MDAYFSIKLPSSGETLEVRLMGDATYDLEVVDQELRFRRENQHVDFLATMMGRTLKVSQESCFLEALNIWNTFGMASV